MKKKLTIRELKDYYNCNQPREISFWTENQPWYRVSNPCKLRYTFPIMTICENPSLVCLQSGGNTLSFDRVKFAEIDTETTILGTVLTLFCANTSDLSAEDTSYILVVA